MMVSVIIPMYNSEKSIRQCLQSVLLQEYTNIECICVDDGSTDQTPKIVKQYQAIHTNLRCITNYGKGPGAARNAGLIEARGDYIAFCDSDDYLSPDFVSKMLEEAKKTDSDTVCCAFWEEFSNFTETHLLEDSSLFDCFFDNAAIWNKIYKTDFLKKNGVVFPHSSRGEDRVFLASVFQNRPKIRVINTPLYHWRRNGKNSLDSVASLLDLQERIQNWITFYSILKKDYRAKAFKNLMDGRSYLEQICEQIEFEADIQEGKRIIETFYTRLAESE